MLEEKFSKIRYLRINTARVLWNHWSFSRTNPTEPILRLLLKLSFKNRDLQINMKFVQIKWLEFCYESIGHPVEYAPTLTNAYAVILAYDVKY